MNYTELHKNTTPNAQPGEEAPALLDLADWRSTDPAVAGGKAATLARLIREGFPVPAGFVVPATARIDAGLPDDLRAAIARALAVLDGPVAVRSSAVDEDRAEASYAGQYASSVDVRGAEAVCQAIEECLASASSERVRAYRQSAGPGQAGMAVLVQHLVDAEAAGVAFSADPVTGDRDVTRVSAVRGLAVDLMDGTASPDEWSVRGEQASCEASHEEALDAEQAQEVAHLAESLEEHMGHPVDIEWAYEEGRLHLLQARPITALPRPPEVDLPDGTWMKDQVHYPELVSPLGATTYLPELESGSAQAFEEVGLVMEKIRQRCVAGEVYGQPVPVGGGGDGPPPPWWVMAILSRIVPSMRRRMKAARTFVRAGLLETLPDWWEGEREALRAEARRLRTADLSSLNDAALVDHLDAARELLRRGQHGHFLLFIPFLVPLHELYELLHEELGWTEVEVMDLVAGFSSASTEPTEALNSLAARIREVPGARACFEEPEPLACLRSEHPDLAARIDDYIERFGWRTTGYDPGAPTLAERPELLASLLRDRVDGTAQDREARLARRQKQADQRAREGLSATLQDRFDHKLAAARRAYPLREDSILWGDAVPCGTIRVVVLEIGRRLVERSLLRWPEEISWLELDEIRATLSDTPPDDLGDRIARRRAEYAWTAAHPGPAHLGPPPADMPDLRGIPAEARRINGAFTWAMGHEFLADDPTERDALLSGVPGSSGSYTGTVRIVRSEAEFDRLRPGEVLVCPITTPVWSVLFGNAGALVTDRGGVLSHPAIVAREHGIPAVLGTSTATDDLQDGDLVTVDGSAGVVRRAK